MGKYTSFQREIFSVAEALRLKGKKRNQFLRDCYIAEEARQKELQEYYYKPSPPRPRA